MKKIETPQISVIIPAYKSTAGLRASVDSVLAQTFQNFEIIIVEDCSCDGGETWQTANCIAADDDRIVVMQTEVNSGAGPARNVGMKAASGEYITFLDADDTLAPETFQNVYSLAKKYNADQVCFAMEIHTANGRVLNRHNDAVEQLFTDPKEIKEFTLNTFSPSLEIGRKRYPGFTISRLCRRSMLLEHNIRFPEKHHFLSEDIAFVYNSMRYVKTFIFTYNSYYRYVMNASSVTHSPKEDMIEKAMASALYFTEMIKNDPDAPDVGVHNAWGHLLDSVRSFAKHMFMSKRSLSFKRRWIHKQAEMPLFKTIYEQYPWQRMPFKHKLGFILFYKKHFLMLYTLIVGQEKLRAILGTTK